MAAWHQQDEMGPAAALMLAARLTQSLTVDICEMAF